MPIGGPGLETVCFTGYNKNFMTPATIPPSHSEGSENMMMMGVG